MAIKFDHELRLTRRRSQDMQTFDADLFVMVLSPSEANYEGREPKYDLSRSRKQLVETGFLQVEGVKPEAKEARRGTRRA